MCRLPPTASIHDRYERLLEAGLVPAADLSLPATLQRIVEPAAGLTGARYGALGVLGRDGVITEFITTGGRTRSGRPSGTSRSGGASSGC